VGGFSTISRAAKFSIVKKTSLFPDKKAQLAASANPPASAKTAKGKAKAETEAGASTQKPAAHTPGQASPLSLRGQGHTAHAPKTRGNPPAETPQAPPSDKTTKNASKGGSKLGRFFQRLFGKDVKTPAAESKAASATSGKTGGTGSQAPLPGKPRTMADPRGPAMTPRPLIPYTQTYEKLAKHFPEEEMGFAKQWAPKVPRNPTVGKPSSADRGKSANASGNDKLQNLFRWSQGLNHMEPPELR
jgi:hypothetical protein